MSPDSRTAVKASALAADAFDAPGIDDLAFSLVAMLHRHPHLSSVLTHISRSNWPRIEHTLRVILDPATQPRDLTPLARNMLDLMVAERGVTGRIFRPYLRALLVALVGPNKAETVLSHIHRLAAPDAAILIIAPKVSATTTGPSAVADDAHNEICDNERVPMVKDIDPCHRHTVVFQLFEQPPPNRALQPMADHDSRPLRAQHEIAHGARCQGAYPAHGPDT